MKTSTNSLQKKIESKTAVVGVIGMGHIGLSILDACAKKSFPLVGYDIDVKKAELLKTKEGYPDYLLLNKLYQHMKKGKFTPSSNPAILKEADIIIISVPLPLDVHHIPNESLLLDAFHKVLENLKKDQLIILQSSTYPGMTEKVLLPLLETSGLKVGKDIFLAYVPETFDIGNKEFPFHKIPRIVGGITPKCLKLAQLLYQKIGCEVLACSSTKIPEAAKLLQNTYRMINICLINELKIMFDRMGIDVWEVIQAASTKPFGFQFFYPSAGAGGDCIPVCPSYLIWEAKETGGPTSLMELSETINESVPQYVVEKCLYALSLQKKSINSAKVLVLGVAYKKNVNDIRHAPSLKVLSLLNELNAEVSYHDFYVKELSHIAKFPNIDMKSIELDYKKLKQYDLVVIITDHTEYNWKKIEKESALVVDTCNVIDANEKVIKA